MIKLSLNSNEMNQITKNYRDSDYARAEQRGKEWEKKDPKFNTYTIHKFPDWKIVGKRHRCVNCHFLAVRLEKTNMQEELTHQGIRQRIRREAVPHRRILRYPAMFRRDRS